MKIPNNLIYAVSGIGVVMILATLLLLINSVYFQTVVVVSLLVTFTPLIIQNYLEYVRVKAIELFLSDFLRDVAESNRSGMPLEKSIAAAAEGNYGPLTDEMKIVSSQISWGISFDEALLKFSKRIKSKLVQQTVLIVVESYRSGGDIAGILETVSADIRSLKDIEAKRRSDLQVYVISTYFIFFLFLAIILVLSKSFVPATPQLNTVAQLVGGTPSKVSEDDFKTFFFHLSLIEAFFAGLVSGQMGEGSITAGFKHSFILIVVTLVSFQIFLAAEPFANRLATDIVKFPPNTISASSATAAYMLYTDTTAENVATIVKESMKSRSEWNDFSKDKIMFVYSDCKPCERGDLIVQSGFVLVKKPTKIMYSITIANGIYTVNIRGAQ